MSKRIFQAGSPLAFSRPLEAGEPRLIVQEGALCAHDFREFDVLRQVSPTCQWVRLRPRQRCAEEASAWAALAPLGFTRQGEFILPPSRPEMAVPGAVPFRYGTDDRGVRTWALAQGIGAAYVSLQESPFVRPTFGSVTELAEWFLAQDAFGRARAVLGWGGDFPLIGSGYSTPSACRTRAAHETGFDWYLFVSLMRADSFVNRMAAPPRPADPNLDHPWDDHGTID